MILAGATAAGGKGGPLYPDVGVSGAGSAAVDGRYSYRGEFNDRHYYNLVGHADDPITFGISVSKDHWRLYGSSTNTVLYTANATTEFPYNDGPWGADSADPPDPAVSEG